MREASVPEGATMFLIDNELRTLITDTHAQVNQGFRAADEALREIAGDVRRIADHLGLDGS